VKADHEFYIPNKDYFGLFPEGNGEYLINDLDKNTGKELNALADEYDMVYYTDLYGIYWTEWHNEYPEIKPEQLPGRVGEGSRLLYGGLHKNEFALLRLMKERQKLIINEFNIIASPTSWRLRKEYEKEFHVNWSGWVGRHFENLDTTINKELPRWLIRNYKQQNNDHWPFTKSGIAFVNNAGEVTILENETHLNSKTPVIHTSKNTAEYYRIPEEINYPLWFDICSTDTTNQVISKYIIHTNSMGDAILKQWHIPKEFPAVIKRKADYPYYYFAGDFADNPMAMKAAKYKYIGEFNAIFYDTSADEQKYFFWTYYRPLLSQILDDYYTRLK
ncbi:MAG: hypothetical protein PF444_08965, partial [Bacteroidales bacterium]|nr:hypothetical protein [Bacteroidales bacterium]